VEILCLYYAERETIIDSVKLNEGKTLGRSEVREEEDRREKERKRTRIAVRPSSAGTSRSGTSRIKCGHKPAISNTSCPPITSDTLCYYRINWQESASASYGTFK